jgi:enoyl-CoA hydratase/carnithine racemase
LLHEVEMSFATVTVDCSEGAFVIGLNRPESRNAINVAMMEDLVAAVHQAGEMRAAAAVIIAGGERFFSAGRDLKEVAANTDRASMEGAKAAWRAVTDSFEKCPKPVIAAIEGHCLTGGLELALACDMRVAGQGASFGVISARLGTLPAFGATQRLPRLVGASKALELMLLAEPIEVDEAHRIGLVNRKTETGGALAECRRMAQLLLERAPLSLAAIKRAVYGGLSMPLPDALDWELALGATLAATRDRREGIAAFAEKRKPDFIGE